MLERVVDTLRHVAAGLVAALLPSPERERWAFAHDLDAPRWSLALGLVQLFLGVGSFIVGGLAYMRTGSVIGSLALLQHWRPGLTTLDIGGMGLVNTLAWLIHPASWPLLYIGLTGVVRCVAFAVTREAVAEPAVWVGVKLLHQQRRRLRDRDLLRRLGPPRDDRLSIEDGGARIVVRAARDKASWTEATTVETGGRYYRVHRRGLVADGGWLAWEYELCEEPPGSVVRRLVAYEPPGAAGP